jgi:hypothetical protein
MTISPYERASVMRRLTLLREFIYTLGHEDLTPAERATSLRSAFAELRELEQTLLSQPSSVNQPKNGSRTVC